MVTLEKYRGSRSRYNCPSCGQPKQFARYIDESGEYIDETVGRCNRESSCGYHLTPKDFFLAFGVQCSRREQMSGLNKLNKMNAVNTLNKMNTMNAVNTIERIEHFDTIDNSFITRSLDHNAENRFLLFLTSFIDPEYIFEMARKYFIGATKDGKTCFWQIDKKGRARTGKIISYIQNTGKRDKKQNVSWIHYELKKHKLLPETFNHQLCFFGEHLLKNSNKPVAVVEAEKTATIASIFIDDFIWLAIGGKSYLKADKLRRFGKRKVVLFPDADGFDLWQREAVDAARIGLNVTVSTIIEDAATDEEKASGYDLADYLISGERKAQKWNLFADAYNEKVNYILEDAELFETFDEMLDERIAIMESETEAIKPENLRLIVDQIAA